MCRNGLVLRCEKPESPMSQLGQTEKNSVRAYVFHFALELGHCSTQSACLKGADSVAKVPKGHEANFPPKNEISDNRRSMQPQTRCRNRLCVWRPTAWSPRLLFDRRAYGSKNLSRMPQKDFCNTIYQEQTWAFIRSHRQRGRATSMRRSGRLHCVRVGSVSAGAFR